MAAISVRDLDEEVAARLKARAARHGRSMEAEVRAILSEAVAAGEKEPPNLAQAIRERFTAVGGVDLESDCRPWIVIRTSDLDDAAGATRSYELDPAARAVRIRQAGISGEQRGGAGHLG